MEHLKLVAPFSPMGDQPEAIRQLVEEFTRGERAQTLLGVTGSGKTFTAANVLQQLNRPTLVLSHNKTLAAQLYSEFKEFFPDNRVEYFVSYYDYYQPEAYIPNTDTYIEKDLAINQDLEKLRLSTTSALLAGRRDVIVVSSVSCMYGIGNPEDFHANTVELRVGQTIAMDYLLRRLVEGLYQRNEISLERGNFRVKGDTVDIAVAYGDYAYRIIFWGDEIERIQTFDPITHRMQEDLQEAVIYPASIFVTTKERLNRAIVAIQDDLVKQVDYFESIGKKVEAQRLLQRVEYDMEMMRELGYCQGIENYSRYFDGRAPGSRPFCLLDYFPDDFVMVVDESHVTIPQIRAMYGGDHSRKLNLVEYGFRLPSALDNRPLKFEEFEQLHGQILFISATPADYELEQSHGTIVEQIIRPTGVLDPIIDVRPIEGQIDDLLGEIHQRIEREERVLVTTLTKKMAEHLSEFLLGVGVKCRYIHSDVDTLERVTILDGLRKGDFHVLIGVNLLREGLDLPEVSLVAILDADKEGFLRSARSLTQTAGRAARNVNGLVIMYADKITDSMRLTIDETTRRREKQMLFNEQHGVVPQQIVKKQRQSLLQGSAVDDIMYDHGEAQPDVSLAAEPDMPYDTGQDLEQTIAQVEQKMKEAAKEKDYRAAARYRDLMFELQAKRNQPNKS
ncbi:MAG: excinuclease ABC subunit B [Bacteroidetes bacterium]|nr:MAG: excinuclease ABC subunit B [Bacteroidota bacterium]